MAVTTTVPTYTSYILANATTQSLLLGMNPGFRAGVGFLLPWERTSLGVAYTYLDVSASKDFSPSGGQTLFPLLTDAAIQALTSTKTEARWTISFQNVDIDFEKRYNISKAVTLLPDIGLKLAWISQHRKVHYLQMTGTDLSGSSFTGATYSRSDRNKFSGMGLKLGGSSLWYMGWGFGFFGLLKGALLAGSFHESEDDVLNEEVIVDLSSRLKRMVPTIQYGVGLDWGHAFGDCAIKFSCAYEAQYWWAQQQFVRFTASNPYYVRGNEALAFQGLTASAGISF